MLKLNKLIEFSEEYVNARANLEKAIIVAIDDEVAGLIEDLTNSGNQCTLITVIPTHDSAIRDEDNKAMKNNLLFFIVKKTDSKAGNAQKLANFVICQNEIEDLLKHIIGLIDAQGEDCLFKNIDYGSAPIIPIPNYFNQNGYLLEISTKTYF
ncbi:hypothetical protein ES692_06190 [Psychroserpens burtonensis]|uniref:Uncharacterized protein n=1 Tax=Psychroserpens burtonensis TaxID=49278 RepID=A0A5C7BAP9_9FLAO|nr:hypothetical protein [Psychroserpens burtonensis]TXE18631.1 hypothetical protein ES692_06190 [Psychroserpens burtonensis]